MMSYSKCRKQNDAHSTTNPSVHNFSLLEPNIVEKRVRDIPWIFLFLAALVYWISIAVLNSEAQTISSYTNNEKNPFDMISKIYSESILFYFGFFGVGLCIFALYFFAVLDCTLVMIHLSAVSTVCFYVKVFTSVDDFKFKGKNASCWYIGFKIMSVVCLLFYIMKVLMFVKSSMKPVAHMIKESFGSLMSTTMLPLCVLLVTAEFALEGAIVFYSVKIALRFIIKDENLAYLYQNILSEIMKTTTESDSDTATEDDYEFSFVSYLSEIDSFGPILSLTMIFLYCWFTIWIFLFVATVNKMILHSIFINKLEKGKRSPIAVADCFKHAVCDTIRYNLGIAAFKSSIFSFVPILLAIFNYERKDRSKKLCKEPMSLLSAILVLPSISSNALVTASSRRKGFYDSCKDSLSLYMKDSYTFLLANTISFWLIIWQVIVVGLYCNYVPDWYHSEQETLEDYSDLERLLINVSVSFPPVVVAIILYVALTTSYEATRHRYFEKSYSEFDADNNCCVVNEVV